MNTPKILNLLLLAAGVVCLMFAGFSPAGALESPRPAPIPTEANTTLTVIFGAPVFGTSEIKTGSENMMTWQTPANPSPSPTPTQPSKASSSQNTYAIPEPATFGLLGLGLLGVLLFARRRRRSGVYRSLVGLVFLLVMSASVAQAQWAAQTIVLQPGWNAVFLEVQPQNTECATVFQGLPVESVWLWNPQSSFVEYIQNPNELKPKDPEWLVWFSPKLSYNALLTNLYHIMGERAYLIKVTGASPVNWTIVGTPKLPRIRWLPNSPNLVGFHLMPGQEPTFAAFFAPSKAHGNAAPEVYRLNTAGNWELAPPTAQMKSGAAYWVQCQETSDYTGPLQLKAPTMDGLDFGKLIAEQDLDITNLRAAAVTVSVVQQPSAPAGPPVDGLIPLSYWVRPPVITAGWNAFTDPIALAYAAKEQLPLRLAIRRTALSAPGVYLSLLNVTDNAGMRILVPVSTGVSSLAAGGGSADKAKADFLKSAETPVDGPPDYTGLWIGTATITAVNRPGLDDDPGTPDVNEQSELHATYRQDKGAGSEFSFRIMLHVPPAPGQVNLLREALQLVCGCYRLTDAVFQNLRDAGVDEEIVTALEAGGPTLVDVEFCDKIEFISKVQTAAGDLDQETQNVILDKAWQGRLVVFTEYDAAQIATLNCTGTGMRDNRVVGRRFSCPAFSFTNPLVMTGVFEIAAEQTPDENDADLETQYTIAFNDPLNPFVHKYHPDHDNKNASFRNFSSVTGAEAPNITRTIKLIFSATDPTNLNLAEPGWQDIVMGGTYRETITGLHHNPMYAQGYFRVTRVTDVGLLNDGR